MNAQTALEQAEAQSVWPNEIFQARAQVYAAEADVAEAQAMLQGTKLIYDRTTGEYRYQQALTAWDIKVWTQNLSDAEAKLTAAQVALDKLLEEYIVETKIAYAQENLREAQAALDKLLAESPVNANEIAVQKQKVDLAQKELYNAQNASKDIAIKKLQVEIVQGQLDDATKAVADAQKALDEAKSASPVIKAPFAGFVTSVNVKGGDDVLKGTVALQIADPNKFETDILVSEMDISQVKLGGNAIVEVEALSGLSLSANVTHISPTATIQQGVVNYKVTVELQSLQSVSGNQTGQTQGFPPVSDNLSGQRPSFPPISDNVSGQGQIPQAWAGGQTSSATTTQAIQLKEGLSVIVSIVTAHRSNVLLVPNGAITTQRGQSYVQVVSSSGTTEQRAIKTGITDDVNTEVTEGLSEGEKVVVSKTTTSTSTTTQQGSQGGINIPFFR
jgi:biotin carboxyl carrier protein